MAARRRPLPRRRRRARRSRRPTRRPRRPLPRRARSMGLVEGRGGVDARTTSTRRATSTEPRSTLPRPRGRHPRLRPTPAPSRWPAGLRRSSTDHHRGARGNGRAPLLARRRRRSPLENRRRREPRRRRRRERVDRPRLLRPRDDRRCPVPILRRPGHEAARRPAAPPRRVEPIRCAEASPRARLVEPASPALSGPTARSFAVKPSAAYGRQPSTQAAAPPAPPRLSARARCAPLFRAETLSPTALRVVLRASSLAAVNRLHGKKTWRG